MDVVEQSDTRLVLVAKTMLATRLISLFAAALALWLIYRVGNTGNNSPVSQFILGPIDVLVVILLLLSPIKSMLVVDRELHQLSIKKYYLFGLIPVIRKTKLEDITAFFVQHQLAYKFRPATLKFIFRLSGRKLTFVSNKLHFAGGSGFFSYLNSGSFDPRTSREETLIPVVAGYVDSPASSKERAFDSTNINRRVLYRTLIFAAGLVFALAAIWIYYHLIHTS